MLKQYELLVQRFWALSHSTLKYFNLIHEFYFTDYGEHVGALACSDAWFDYEAMGKVWGSKHIARFIDNCRQTQIFEMFACERLLLKAENYPSEKMDIFEREVLKLICQYLKSFDMIEEKK